MTFKEMSLQDDAFILGSRREKSGLASLLDNVSPVMKLWFAIMAANLLMLLFLM